LEKVRVNDLENDFKLLLRTVVEETLRLRSAALFNPVYEIVDTSSVHFPLEVHALFKFVGVIPASLG